MGQLMKLFHDKPVISVQNGIRSNSYVDIGRVWDNSVTVPHYYGFGDYEKDMFKLKNVKMEAYVPTGSIKMAAFVSKYNNWISKCTKEASLFCHNLEKSMLKLNDPLLNDFIKVLKQTYINLVIWSEKNKIKLVIALFYVRDEEAHEDELKFYQDGMEKYSHVEYSANNRKKMISYKRGIESEVVVSLDSTLIYELFGYGCKSLFCVGADKDFLHRWGCKGNISKMPKLVLLEQLKSSHFEDKMDKLFYIEHQKYMAITEGKRDHII